MYAAAHTALALAGKRRMPSVSLFGLMVASQGAELLWVGLNYAGIEHTAVDARGQLHLDYLPISHSVFTGVVGGLALWAALRLIPRWRAYAGLVGIMFASHIVLDIVHHEPNIRLVPWLAAPAIGLNLQVLPWLDFIVETGLCIACWAYYRGNRKLLVGLLGLNLLNLPLMLSGDGSSARLSGDHVVLPTIILVTIVVAWAVIGVLGRSVRPDITASQPAPASEPAEPAAT